MKRLILFTVLIVSTTTVFALNQTPAINETATIKETPAAQETVADKVEVKNNGRIWVNGQKPSVTLQYDGTQLPLRGEHILASAGKNPGLFLSIYPDGLTSKLSLTQHLIILDATGKKFRRSNVLDTGIDFQ